MKGTLHKTESGWQVWYHAKEDLFYGNTRVRILPLIDSDYYEVSRPGQYNDGKEVEFEIFDNREICDCDCHRNPDITHFIACCNNGYRTDNLGHVNYYAKLVDKATRPLTEDDAWPEYPTRADQLREQAWDIIIREFHITAQQVPKGAPPLIFECWLTKNYNPPTKKQ